MELTTDEIRFMIDGFTDGTIPDYQMSAMTMAICFQGMSKRETVDLTLAMRDSGDVLDLSSIPGVKVDKHSTGGVGDKTSLALTPIIASLGVPVAKDVWKRTLAIPEEPLTNLRVFRDLRLRFRRKSFLKMSVRSVLHWQGRRPILPRRIKSCTHCVMSRLPSIRCH